MASQAPAQRFVRDHEQQQGDAAAEKDYVEHEGLHRVRRDMACPLIGIRGGSPPAVMNAVVDALKDFGVRHIEMPATPAKIWNIINGGRRMAAE